VSHRLVLAPEAREQLDDLYDYIAGEASPAAARQFTDAIVDRLDLLRDFPNVGAPRDDVLPGLRTLGFRRRVTIAYVVEPAQVLVLGVYYGGQDFETILRGG